MRKFLLIHFLVIVVVFLNIYLFCMGCFQAAQRKLEQQRKEEWEKQRRGELQLKKEQDMDDIAKLKAKKGNLEMELEAVVSHKKDYQRRLSTTEICTSYRFLSSFLRETSTVKSQSACRIFRTSRSSIRQN